jgi:hypothetical protein
LHFHFSTQRGKGTKTLRESYKSYFIIESLSFLKANIKLGEASFYTNTLIGKAFFLFFAPLRLCVKERATDAFLAT